LYEKLIQKQAGKEVLVFRNVTSEVPWADDPLTGTKVVDIAERRTITMREIADFGKDFDIMPHKLGISNLEQCFFAAHSSNDQKVVFDTKGGLNYGTH
jgi:hypothetical protein